MAARTKKKAKSKTTRKTTTKSASTQRSTRRRSPLMDMASPGRREAAVDLSVARRTTNRTTAVDVDAGAPPEGPVTREALEAEIAAWIAKPRKRPSDYCAYKLKSVLEDAKEMRSGRADLPAFAAKRTPITARHFDWLDLIQEGLTELGDDETEAAGDNETISENILRAMEAVLDARAPLASRAEVCGIPLLHFTLKDSYKSPYTLHDAAGRAARQARRKLDRFNDADYALQLIENLEERVGTLRTLIEGDEDLAFDTREQRLRRAALKRLLYDCLSFIGSWGRDVTLGNPARRYIYALDNIFPSERAQDAADEDHDGGTSVAGGVTPSPAGSNGGTVAGSSTPG